MESSGDALVPMKSAVSFKESCGTLQIQIIGRLPGMISQQNKIFGSFRPYLQVRTQQLGLIVPSELIGVEDFSMFSSIQDILDASPARSTILIPEGRYIETLLITKPVRLIGSGKSVLFGSIQILSHDVTLDVLSIYSLNALKPTLEITFSSNVVIHNCRIEQGEYSNSNLLVRKTQAVRVANSSSVSFINNQVVDFGIGIEVWNSSKCVLQSNRIQSCWTALRISGLEDLRVVGNYMRENMVLVSLMNLSELLHIRSLVGRNMLEDNVHLTYEDETETRKILANSVANKTFQELMIDRTVVITGSCYEDTEEIEPCAHYRTGRQTVVDDVIYRIKF